MTPQTETQSAARRFALEHGSATNALSHLDAHIQSGDFRLAVGALASLENGTSVAWKADEARAEWMAELEAEASRVATVEKASLTLNFACAA